MEAGSGRGSQGPPKVARSSARGQIPAHYRQAAGRQRRQLLWLLIAINYLTKERCQIAITLTIEAMKGIGALLRVSSPTIAILSGSSTHRIRGALID